MGFGNLVYDTWFRSVSPWPIMQTESWTPFGPTPSSVERASGETRPKELIESCAFNACRVAY